LLSLQRGKKKKKKALGKCYLLRGKRNLGRKTGEKRTCSKRGVASERAAKRGEKGIGKKGGAIEVEKRASREKIGKETMRGAFCQKTGRVVTKTGVGKTKPG